VISCRDFAEFVWKYLSGELPAEERFQFDAHLAVCPHCVRYLRSYQETIRLGKEAFRDPDDAVPPEVPESLVRAILAAREAGDRKAPPEDDP
jgi:anti-sigma factor RsiW